MLETVTELSAEIGVKLATLPHCPLRRQRHPVAAQYYTPARSHKR